MEDANKCNKQYKIERMKSCLPFVLIHMQTPLVIKFIYLHGRNEKTSHIVSRAAIDHRCIEENARNKWHGGEKKCVHLLHTVTLLKG